MSHCGHHHHDHGLIGRKLWLAILLNVIVTVAQIIAGFSAGSLSLLSDALHNFSDVVALMFSYIALRLTGRASTPRETFGYKRGEIVAAFVNTASLLAIAALLIKEAVTRLLHPVAVDPAPIIALGILSVVVNWGSVLLIRREANYSLNIRSAYLHLFSDILSSIALVVGGAVMYWTKFYWIDSVLSILIACYLVVSSWKLLMDIMRIIMHFTPQHIDLKEVEQELLAHGSVANVHHVHIWRLNDAEIHFEGHIDFKRDLSLSEVSQIITQLSQQVRTKFGISHTVLQPEIGVQDSKQLIVSECHTLKKDHGFHE